MSVRNLNSPRSGKPVANQFEIRISDRIIFKSYEKIIAIRNTTRGETMVNKDYWDSSQTTLKYFKVWLGTSKSKAQLDKHMKENYPQFSLVDDLMMQETYYDLMG